MAKGQGTFRRTLLSALAVMGLPGAGDILGSVSAAGLKEPSMIPNEDARPQDRKRRRRSRVLKGKHTPSAKNFTVLRWGDCPAPLSRKMLKRIASSHPILHQGRF